jgi:hypothetical protein
MTSREVSELDQVVKLDMGTQPGAVIVTPSAIPQGDELYFSILKAAWRGVSVNESLLLPKGTALTCHP